MTDTKEPFQALPAMPDFLDMSQIGQLGGIEGGLLMHWTTWHVVVLRHPKMVPPEQMPEDASARWLDICRQWRALVDAGLGPGETIYTPSLGLRFDGKRVYRDLAPLWLCWKGMGVPGYSWALLHTHKDPTKDSRNVPLLLPDDVLSPADDDPHRYMTRH